MTNKKAGGIPGNGFGKNRPTLKSIAELTGLSLSSVSLALRDDTSLKAETRDKVRKTAREIGYVPDRAGVRLRTGKSNVLALILPSSEDSSGFSEKLIQGVGAGLKNTNYHLTVVPEFSQDTPVENTRYIIENGLADGIILTHTEPRDDRVRLMMDAGFPFVTNGRTEFFSQHPYHDIHGENFARMAAQRLVSVGCTNLTLIIGNDRTMNRQYIINAFNRSISDYLVSGHVLTVDSSQNLIDTINAASLDMPQKSDGFICNEEFMGLQLCHAKLRKEVILNRNFYVVSRESSGILPLLFPNTDTIMDDLFAMGKGLVSTLIRRIQGDAEVSDLQTLLQPIPQWRSDAEPVTNLPLFRSGSE